MARLWKCKCGEYYTGRQQLKEHIALMNWKWPAKSYDDMHCELVQIEVMEATSVMAERKL